MVKNPERLEKFKNTLYKSEGPFPFIHSLKIFTSMWNQRVKIGVLAPKKPMEGIETDIKIAAVLNSLRKKNDG